MPSPFPSYASGSLFTLKRAAFHAGKQYHAACSRYFGALSIHAPDVGINKALEEAILWGEKYRTALIVLLEGLRRARPDEDTTDTIVRVERVLELLDLELKKFFAFRSARQA